jgi:hypothetical protein
MRRAAKKKPCLEKEGKRSSCAHFLMAMERARSDVALPPTSMGLGLGYSRVLLE